MNVRNTATTLSRARHSLSPTGTRSEGRASYSLTDRCGCCRSAGERYSIAYHHDQLWQGAEYLRFGKEINDSHAFRSLS